MMGGPDLTITYLSNIEAGTIRDALAISKMVSTSEANLLRLNATLAGMGMPQLSEAQIKGYTRLIAQEDMLALKSQERWKAEGTAIREKHRLDASALRIREQAWKEEEKNFRVKQRLDASTAKIRADEWKAEGDRIRIKQRLDASAARVAADELRAEQQMQTEINKTFSFLSKKRDILTEIGGLAMPGLIGVGAMVGTFALAVSSVAKYEQSMIRISALVGETDYSALNDQIIQLSNAYGISADEMAQAAVEVAKQGFNYTQIMDMLTPATYAAVGSQLSIADAIVSAIPLMRSYNIQGNEINRMFDLMAVIANKTNIDMSEFSEGLKYSASMAKMLGVDYADLLRLMAFGSDVALKAGMTGREFTMVMKEMIELRENKVALDELNEALGVSIPLFVDGKLNLAELMETLEGAKTDIDAVTEVFEKFGLRGGRLFALMMSQASRYNEIRRETTDVEGANKEMADKVAESMSTVLDRLKNMFANTFKTTESMKTLSDAVTQLGEGIKGIMPEFQGMTTALITGFVQILPNLINVINIFFKSIGDSLPTLILSAEIFMSIISALSPLLTILPLLIPLWFVWKGITLAQAAAQLYATGVQIYYTAQTWLLSIATNAETTAKWALVAANIAVHLSTIVMIGAALAAIALIWVYVAAINRQAEEVNKNIDATEKYNDATGKTIDQNNALASSYNSVSSSISETSSSLKDYVDAYLVLTRETGGATFIMGGGVGVGAREGGRFISYNIRIDRIVAASAGTEEVKNIWEEMGTELT